MCVTAPRYRGYWYLLLWSGGATNFSLDALTNFELSLLNSPIFFRWFGKTGATLGNAFFMSRVFVPYRAQEPARLLGAFYGAELQKLILIAVLFAGVLFWLQPLSPMALFGTFLLVQLVPAVVATFSS